MKKYTAEMGSKIYKVTEEQVETMCKLCKSELKKKKMEPVCTTCGFSKDNMMEVK